MVAFVGARSIFRVTEDISGWTEPVGASSCNASCKIHIPCSSTKFLVYRDEAFQYETYPQVTSKLA